MSIVKRGNSKNWYIHFQFNGQTYIRSSKSTNKKIAESMEIEFKAILLFRCLRAALGNLHSGQLFRS